jgi:hypothetical protein
MFNYFCHNDPELNKDALAQMNHYSFHRFLTLIHFISFSNRVRPNLFFILLIVFSLNSCIIVKLTESSDTTPTINLSPKPEIELSDILIRSKQGDMIAFLPKGWFLIDALDKVSSDVIAVAVSPDYSLSAVFSEFRSNEQTSSIIEKEGLLGLARLSLAKRERKTAGTIKIIGKYTPIEIGPNSFVKYEYSASGGGLSSMTAVFKSTLNLYYEFTLVPIETNRMSIPLRSEIDKIFQSFIASIKF